MARFNKISEDIRQQYPLPHDPVKSLIEKSHTSGIYKNLNLARDQIISLMKDASIASRMQLETVVALLNQ